MDETIKPNLNQHIELELQLEDDEFEPPPLLTFLYKQAKVCCSIMIVKSHAYHLGIY